MRSKSILGLLICFALAFSLSFAQPTNAASAEEEVLQVAANFAKAMNTNDGQLMSSLWYAPEASAFGPFKSVSFLFQGETLNKHWKSFSELPEGTISCTLQNQQVTMLDSNASIITSYAIMTSGPPATKETVTSQIRRTLVVQKIGGKWLIIHGHDSVLPTE